MRCMFLICALTLLLPHPAAAVSVISKAVIGSGATGGGAVTNSVHSTSGQDATGIVFSVHHMVHSGFWGNGTPGSVGVGDQAPIVPTRLQLAQNNPNPFGPRTSIAYVVPGPGGHVALTIYGMDGRRIRTLIAANQLAGRHGAEWDGRDDYGRRVPPGAYVYALETPGSRLARKMILLR